MYRTLYRSNLCMSTSYNLFHHKRPHLFSSTDSGSVPVPAFSNRVSRKGMTCCKSPCTCAASHSTSYSSCFLPARECFTALTNTPQYTVHPWTCDVLRFILNLPGKCLDDVWRACPKNHMMTPQTANLRCRDHCKRIFGAANVPAHESMIRSPPRMYLLIISSI